MEIWKEIDGYKGLYKINNMGDIITLPREMRKGKAMFMSKEKTMKQSNNTMGYKVVNLTKNGKHKIERVHRLMASNFLGKATKDKPIVNHKDGNKKNNNIENLEWCNNSKNQLHAIETGLRSSFKITKEELKLEYEINNLTTTEISKKYHTTSSIINNNFKKSKLKRHKKSKFILDYEFLKKELKTKTQTELAKELGCTQSLICHTLKKYKRS